MLGFSFVAAFFDQMEAVMETVIPDAPEARSGTQGHVERYDPPGSGSRFASPE